MRLFWAASTVGLAGIAFAWGWWLAEDPLAQRIDFARSHPEFDPLAPSYHPPSPDWPGCTE
jgi:hypothetical protein